MNHLGLMGYLPLSFTFSFPQDSYNPSLHVIALVRQYCLHITASYNYHSPFLLLSLHYDYNLKYKAKHIQNV